MWFHLHGSKHHCAIYGLILLFCLTQKTSIPMERGSSTRQCWRPVNSEFDEKLLWLPYLQQSQRLSLCLCSFVGMLYPSGSIVLDLYLTKGGWLSKNTFADSHTQETFLVRACCSCQRSGVLLLSTCLLGCLQRSPVLSLHVRRWLYRDMSALTEYIYTQGATGWVESKQWDG